MAIIVARDVPAKIYFDICVIGAGASGLTIASNFLNKLNVGVLESGGLEQRPLPSEPGEDSQPGMRYAPLSTSRLKGFGGSTQSYGWGGLCKPLDAQDFAARPWVQNSGWPFGIEDLAPYYDRARETLGLGEIEVLAGRQQVFPGRSGVISSDNVELCRHYRLGRHLAQPVAASSSVTVMTKATVQRLEFGETGTDISAALCVDAGDRPFHVIAKVFVLAAGGIENARLLLLSNSAAGRRQGLVGRYFMDHPRFVIGTLEPADGCVKRVLARFDRIRIARRQRIVRRLKLERDRRFRVKGLTLPLDVQEREGLLNYRAWVEPCYVGQNASSLESMRHALLAYRDQSILSGKHSMLGALMKGMTWTRAMHLVRPLSLVRSFRLHHIMEPEPYEASAVSLSSSKDRYGLPRAALSWQVSSTTLESLRKTIGLLQGEFKSSGLGKLEVTPEEWDQLERPMWTWHHMGTTRMNADPDKGVVDANCKVHGITNLFVAGSSVFPTVGNDTPTITIVALAHRLSDYLLKFLA